VLRTAIIDRICCGGFATRSKAYVASRALWFIVKQTTKISIRNVSKSFVKRNGGARDMLVEALKDVSLEVADCEFISVVGPSGCGKTTLLRLIDGLMPCEKGEIMIDGRPVSGPGQDRGMVFQTFGLLPWRTVADNVALGLEIAGVAPEARKSTVQHWIEIVGLAGFAHHYPHELSGGMQQRVGLARVLAINPAVILMDEPFGALDAQTREFMQEELLRMWNQETKTVVFITHSIDEAIYLSDRVAVMSARPGRIVEIREVNLPRPRWDYDARSAPAFSELRAHIWQRLRQDRLGANAPPLD
jgi:NitT/TauT family transport system ATP-binding protein